MMIMKKFLFSICALFVANCTFADNTYSIDKVLLNSNGQADVFVNFSLEDGFPCGGFGLTLQLPEELEFVDATVTPGDCYASAPSFTTNILPSGALKIGYSSSTLLTKQSGCLLSCRIQAKSSVSAGTVLTANLVDGMFVQAPMTSVAVSDISFQIEITDKIVLDENSPVVPVAATGNVIVKRTLTAGKWQTICLPFDMSDAQTKAAFGEGVQFAELPETNFYTGTSSITVNFKPSDIAGDKFYANWPYLVKPTKDVDYFTVDNVTVDPYEEGAVQTWSVKSGKVTVIMGKFVGLLSSGKTIPEDNLFISNNKFYYSTGSTTIKGFRGYFYFKDFTSSSPAPNFVVDGETTNIEGLQIVDGDGRIYNLNGQHVENPTKKGVYIQNGKKVVMKK